MHKEFYRPGKKVACEGWFGLDIKHFALGVEFYMTHRRVMFGLDLLFLEFHIEAWRRTV